MNIKEHVAKILREFVEEAYPETSLLFCKLAEDLRQVAPDIATELDAEAKLVIEQDRRIRELSRKLAPRLFNKKDDDARIRAQAGALVESAMRDLSGKKPS